MEVAKHPPKYSQQWHLEKRGSSTLGGEDCWGQKALGEISWPSLREEADPWPRISHLQQLHECWGMLWEINVRLIIIESKFWMLWQLVENPRTGLRRLPSHRALSQCQPTVSFLPLLPSNAAMSHFSVWLERQTYDRGFFLCRSFVVSQYQEQN